MFDHPLNKARHEFGQREANHLVAGKWFCVGTGCLRSLFKQTQTERLNDHADSSHTRSLVRLVCCGWKSCSCKEKGRDVAVVLSSSKLQRKEAHEVHFYFLTSIFVLPPNLNQQNIGSAVPWQPAVFFLPPQTCSTVRSNVISIKHLHVDREQLTLNSKAEFGLRSEYNYMYFEGNFADLIDSPKSMRYLHMIKTWLAHVCMDKERFYSWCNLWALCSCDLNSIAVHFLNS